jgi:hypothetical protein
VGLLLSGQSIVPTGDATLHGDDDAHLSITYLEPRKEGPTTFELDGPFDLEIGEILAVSGPRGALRIDTGEVHSLAEDGALDTWEVRHRWTAETRVDEPGWIPGRDRRSDRGSRRGVTALRQGEANLGLLVLRRAADEREMFER